MTKNSPLRRLSVALKLRQAFDPPQPVASADAPSISQFLRAAKESFLRDVKEDPAKAAGQWTVVMGNEAGGKFIFFIGDRYPSINHKTPHKILTLSRVLSHMHGSCPRLRRSLLYLWYKFSMTT